MDKVFSSSQNSLSYSRIGTNQPVQARGDDDEERPEALVDGALVAELPAIGAEFENLVRGGGKEDAEDGAEGLGQDGMKHLIGGSNS